MDWQVLYVKLYSNPWSYLIIWQDQSWYEGLLISSVWDMYFEKPPISLSTFLNVLLFWIHPTSIASCVRFSFLYFEKIFWKNVAVDVVEPVTEIELTELPLKMPMIMLKLCRAFRNPFNKSISRVRVLKWETLYINTAHMSCGRFWGKKNLNRYF